MSPTTADSSLPPPMHDTPFSAEPVPSAPRTLIESAYEQVRHDIVSGVLQPGQRLRVEHLREHYAVGGSTLREALTRLVSETLVIAEGQRGFTVAPLSLEDFEDLTRTRVLLECEALRQSIAHGDDRWEGEVLAAFHRLSRAEEKLADDTRSEMSDEWEARNRAFHRTLLAACPSRWLLHFLGILYQQSERYRRFVLIHPTIPRDVHAEHLAIKNAAVARDSEAAAQLIGSHIQTTLEAVRKAPAEAFALPTKGLRLNGSPRSSARGKRRSD